jgi:hypothetical protein
MSESLVPRLMAEIGTRRTRSLGDKKPTLWPSQASANTPEGVVGQCLRASFYGKTGVPQTNPVSDGVKMMGYMGMEIEDGIIDLLKNLGLWDNNNVKWQAKGLSGEVDAIIREQNSDGTYRKYVLEVKSCQGYYANKEVYGFWAGRAPNKAYQPGKPKDPHLMQAAIYADISKGECTGSLIVYVSRDEAKLCEFWIEIDDDGRILIDGVPELRFTMHDIYERYGALKEHIDLMKLPTRDFRHTYSDAEVADIYTRKGISKAANDAHMNGKKPYQDKGCLYCSHRDQCLLDGDRETSLALEPVEVEETPAATVENPPSANDAFADWDQPSAQTQDTAPEFARHGSI